MTVRSKKYELKAGDVRQIKIIDIEAPIRFKFEGGFAGNYEVLLNDTVVVTSTGLAEGVLVAPGGAWGSEVRITCTTPGTIHIAHVG